MDRSHLTLDRAETAIGLVDFQERLAAAMPPDVLQRAERRAALLLRTARILDLPVVVTEQYPDGLGATVDPLLDLLDDVERHAKVEFSAGRVPDVLERLEETGARSVVLCGMEAHVCVYQTALDLLDEGLAVHVCEDAVVSRRTADRETARTMLRDAGAVVSTVEAVVFQLLGRAGTPEFKELAPHLKEL